MKKQCAGRWDCNGDYFRCNRCKPNGLGFYASNQTGKCMAEKLKKKKPAAHSKATLKQNALERLALCPANSDVNGIRGAAIIAMKEPRK